VSNSTSFAVADGVRIRIHHLGGSGEPLVCMHATGFHGRVWEPFVPRLREHFSIVALDQRGHGDSDKPDEGYEWKVFGDDVLAVVDELGLERPAGIGHSAGAAALIFAETTRPGTFSRLVLMDPTTMPPEWRGAAQFMENPMSESARRRRAVWDSPEQMVERLKKGSPLAEWQDEFLNAYAIYGTTPREDGTVELKCPPHIEAQIYATAGTNDGWDRLAHVRCPALLLTGEHSHMWMDGRNEDAVKRLPKGRTATVPGGHFFPMENPDATLDLITSFLLEAS
jgi:pimeloyl-ACP methyl ester carboxylesterase